MRTRSISGLDPCPEKVSSVSDGPAFRLSDLDTTKTSFYSVLRPKISSKMSSASDNQDWQILPVVYSGIFEKIILNFGDDDESIDSCRQVCSSWNNMLKRKLKQFPSKKWGPIMQRRIEKSWLNFLPSAERISYAKSLGK